MVGFKGKLKGEPGQKGTLEGEPAPYSVYPLKQNNYVVNIPEKRKKQRTTWLWVENGYPKWNPGKWKQKLNPRNPSSGLVEPEGDVAPRRGDDGLRQGPLVLRQERREVLPPKKTRERGEGSCSLNDLPSLVAVDPSAKSLNFLWVWYPWISQTKTKV